MYCSFHRKNIWRKVRREKLLAIHQMSQTLVLSSTIKLHVNFICLPVAFSQSVTETNAVMTETQCEVKLINPVNI